MPISHIQSNNESTVKLIFTPSLYNDKLDNLHVSNDNESYQVDQDVKEYFKQVIREIEIFPHAYEIVMEFGDSETPMTKMISKAEIILKDIAEMTKIFDEVKKELKSKFSTADESNKITCEVKTISNDEITSIGETYHFENMCAAAA